MAKTNTPMLHAALVVGLGVLACTAHTPEPATAKRAPAKALCIPPPEPERVAIGGRPTDQWQPDCTDAELIAPCQFGVACDTGDCSCACEHNGDCHDMLVGVEHYARGPIGVADSDCNDGRCVWRQP